MKKDNVINIDKFKDDTPVRTDLRRVELGDEYPDSTIIEIYKDGDEYSVNGWYGSRNFKILLDILTSGIDIDTLRLDVKLDVDKNMEEDKDDLVDHINHYSIIVIANAIPIFEIVFSQYFYKDGENDDLAPISLIRSLEKPEDMYNPILDIKEHVYDRSDYIPNEYTPLYNHNEILSGICYRFDNCGIVLDVVDKGSVINLED